MPTPHAFTMQAEANYPCEAGRLDVILFTQTVLRHFKCKLTLRPGASVQCLLRKLLKQTPCIHDSSKR